MTSAPTPPRPAPVPALPERGSNARFSGLDGLRALAVLAVVAFHLVPSALVGGFIGVDIFFVLSGFLITTLLVREERISLPKFWLRRARRLLPALALVVLVSSSAALVIGGDVLVGLGLQVLGTATFSSNWISIVQGASYFDATTPELFRNFWSLAVEEQFYLLWPILVIALLLVRQRWLRVVLVAAVAIASAVAMAIVADPGGDATRVYYGTDTHSFGLALGAAIALLPPLVHRAWRILLPLVGLLAIAAIALLAAVLREDAAFVTHGGLQLVALLSGLAILGASAADGTWLGRVLDIPPLRWIGERSYGIYLWHWPLLVLVDAAIPQADEWIAPAVTLVLTAAAATVSYRWVEHPIRTRGFRAAAASLRLRPRRLVATSVAVLAAVGLTTTALVVAPKAGEAQFAIEQGNQAIEDAATPRPEPSPDEPAPLPAGDQITAVGDSVMLAAAPELQTAFPGISIDAAVSRQMWQVEDIVQSAVDTGTLRPILVIGLGTNGSIDRESLDAVQRIVPRQTLIVVINAQAPRDWVPTVNQTLADFARTERSVELANWFDAIQPHLDVLASDEIHPGPTGGRIYAGAVTDALQRLAELPPLLRDNDYGLADRPV